jgi:hypothetical protein
VPPSGFAECESPAGHDDAEARLRSGPCLISPNGGFRFPTALVQETTEIVLFGLLEATEDTITGHGTWGSRLSGQTLGTWTAVSHR